MSTYTRGTHPLINYDARGNMSLICPDMFRDIAKENPLCCSCVCALTHAHSQHVLKQTRWHEEECVHTHVCHRLSWLTPLHMRESVS